MDIENYKYLWTSEKENWVLVNTEFGYAVVNKKEKVVLSFSNGEMEDKIIQKMLYEVNKIFNNIVDAYNN